MAKRGRPSLGKTVSIRVPEDIYLLITWIAAAERRSAVRVMEDNMWMPLSQRYLKLLGTIKKLKEVEDQQAGVEGRKPLPLPNGVLAFNPDLKKMIPLHILDLEKYPPAIIGGKPLLGWRIHDSFDVELSQDIADLASLYRANDLPASSSAGEQSQKEPDVAEKVIERAKELLEHSKKKPKKKA